MDVLLTLFYNQSSSSGYASYYTYYAQTQKENLKVRSDR